MTKSINETKVNIVSEYFRQTMDKYGITGKSLSEVSGISENHISDFRRAKSKTGVSTKVLLQLIEAMDELAPGSRRYFCSLLAGNQQDEELADKVINLVEVLEPVEIAQLLNAHMDRVAEAMFYLPDTARADIMTAIAQSLRLNYQSKATVG